MTRVYQYFGTLWGTKNVVGLQRSVLFENN